MTHLLEAILSVLAAVRGRTRAISATGAVALLSVLACGEPSAPVPPTDAVAAVVVTPEQRRLVVGETATLTATPRSTSGRPLEGRTVTWASSDTAVAAVTPHGHVVAVRPGSATVFATSEAKTGRAVIVVGPVPVSSVRVAPTGLVLEQGGTRQLTVVVRDAAGSVVTGRAVAWTTDNPMVATVSLTGLATAATPGYATIVATSEGKSFGVGVTVLAPPAAGIDATPSASAVAPRLTAPPRDRPVGWTSGRRSGRGGGGS